MLINILTPNAILSDERGKLTQLVREGFRQVNVIFSKMGAFRGNHYHAVNREVFFTISGAFEIIAERNGVNERYTFGTGDMFEVPPFVRHSFHFLDDTTLISMYDKGVETLDDTGKVFLVTDILTQ